MTETETCARGSKRKSKTLCIVTYSRCLFFSVQQERDGSLTCMFLCLRTLPRHTKSKDKKDMAPSWKQMVKFYSCPSKLRH